MENKTPNMKPETKPVPPKPPVGKAEGIKG